MKKITEAYKYSLPKKAARVRNLVKLVKNPQDMPSLNDLLTIKNEKQAQIRADNQEKVDAPFRQGNHKRIADMYLNMNPAERHQMLHIDLPSWGEDAKTELAKTALDFAQHGLSSTDAKHIWQAATNQPDTTPDETTFFKNAINWAKKLKQNF